MLGGKRTRTPGGRCHHPDAGRQHLDFLLSERVEHRTPAGVGKNAKPRNERFGFERCRADNEDAQS
jgi:hypothetical protein